MNIIEKEQQVAQRDERALSRRRQALQARVQALRAEQDVLLAEMEEVNTDGSDLQNNDPTLLPGNNVRVRAQMNDQTDMNEGENNDGAECRGA